jgi:hypothetical protein
MEKIKIDFTKTSEDGVYSFSDALHLPINHPYTYEEIETMKQERFDRWLNMILNPPEPVEEPVEEQLIEEPIEEQSVEETPPV